MKEISEFEIAIAGHVSLNRVKGGEVIDARGVEKARIWLLNRVAELRTPDAGSLRGTIKRSHHVATLREIAYQLSLPGNHRLASGEPCGF